MNKFIKDPGDKFDPSMKTIETKRAAEIKPESTQIQTAEQYAETAAFLGRYTYDPKKMAQALAKRVDRMHKKYATLYASQDINPVYLERFEATEALKQKLKTYMGSDSATELLHIKQQAELDGKDFATVAREKIHEMEGHDIVDSRPKEAPKPQVIRRKGLISRLIDAVFDGEPKQPGSDHMSWRQYYNGGGDKK